MNKVFSLVAGFCMLFLISANAQQVYFEDFEDDADNDLAAGTAVGGTWSTTFAGGGDVWSQEENVALVGDVFLAENIQSEGVWRTNAVTITTSYVSLDLEGSTAFTEAGDYMRAYYSINGGAETLFFDKATSTGFSLDVVGQTAIIAITPGQTIQIVVRMFNNANNDYFALDDVSISEIRTLYSRANAAWNASGTWSTAGLGGVSCACTPDDFTRQVIGGNTVQFTASANTTDLEIRTGGELDWDGNFDLNVIKQGTITVDNGGVLDRDGFADAQIDYDEAFTFSIVNNGTFTIGDIDVNAATTLTISGTTAITVASDFLIGATATITNDLAATLAVTGTLHFEAGAGTFVNNGVMTAGALLFNSDNCTVTNASSLTIAGNISANGNGDDTNQVTNNAGATLAFAILDGDASTAGSGDGGDLSIVNSGTINQSGTFLDIPNNTNGANDINNNNGATWNYAGTGHDTNLRLFTSATNTFNYNANGAQQIITPVAGSSYDNLTMSIAGAKSALGSFSVTGNWTRSGTATFTPGANTVTLSGSAAQTITAVGGETFNNLTLNNSFATIPQITTSNNITVAGTLDMTSGVVNLGGAIFILGSAGVASDLNRTASTTTNWMYNGSFRRFWLSGTAVSTAGNLYGLFPVGSSAASSYRPVQVNSTVNPTATGSYTVTHTNQTTSTNLSPVFNDAGTNIVRKNDSQFVCTISGVTGGTYDVGVTMTGLDAGTLSDIRLAVSNGATTVTTVGTHFAAGGTAQNPNARRTGVTLAGLTGDFRITTTNSTNTPLPITLTYFKANLEDDNVRTEWATAQEIDNDFFTVQKTADLETFYDIENIPGQGNTREKHVYSLIDKSPFAGRSYYRLKQTDFDGKYTYSDLVTVDYHGPTEVSIHAYPNPFDGKQITIELKGVQKSEMVPVQIYNQQGVKMFDMILSGDGPGVIEREVNFNTTLPQGLYIIRAGKTLQLTRKIVVN